MKIKVNYYISLICLIFLNCNINDVFAITIGNSCVQEATRITLERLRNGKPATPRFDMKPDDYAPEVSIRPSGLASSPTPPNVPSRSPASISQDFKATQKQLDDLEAKAGSIGKSQTEGINKNSFERSVTRSDIAANPTQVYKTKDGRYVQLETVKRNGTQIPKTDPSGANYVARVYDSTPIARKLPDPKMPQPEVYETFKLDDLSIIDPARATTKKDLLELKKEYFRLNSTLNSQKPNLRSPVEVALLEKLKPKIQEIRESTRALLKSQVGNEITIGVRSGDQIAKRRVIVGGVYDNSVSNVIRVVENGKPKAIRLDQIESISLRSYDLADDIPSRNLTQPEIKELNLELRKAKSIQLPDGREVTIKTLPKDDGKLIVQVKPDSGVTQTAGKDLIVHVDELNFNKHAPREFINTSVKSSVDRLKFWKGNVGDELFDGIPAVARNEMEKFYALVDKQSDLGVLAINPVFRDAPRAHPALFSDHGVIHMRDTVKNTEEILAQSFELGLVNPQILRPESMMQLAKLQAMAHDIGMSNLSVLGRQIHPEFATQYIMSPNFNPILDALWNGKVNAKRLPIVEDIEKLASKLNQDPKQVFREMLSTVNAHSKSKVPIDILNDPVKMAEKMRYSANTNLSLQAAKENVAKAEKALKSAVDGGEKTAGKLPELQKKLENANVILKDAQTIADLTKKSPPAGKQYSWMESDIPELKALTDDVRSTNRALRAGDAHRQRGLTLRTSGNNGNQAYVTWDGRTVNNLADAKTDKQLLLFSNDSITAGEANISKTEFVAKIDPKTNLPIKGEAELKIAFAKGDFGSADATNKMADDVAKIIEDIKKDSVDSFTPAGVGQKAPITITIERTLEKDSKFAEQVQKILADQHGINVKVVDADPSTVLKYEKSIKLGEVEKVRFDNAKSRSIPVAEQKDLLARIEAQGQKVDKIKLEAAFNGVKVIKLNPGDTLIQNGAKAEFVYISKANLKGTDLGGYKDFVSPAYQPLGITGVVRDLERNATLVYPKDAKEAIEVYAIPKDVYRKHWFDAYTPKGDFNAALDRQIATVPTANSAADLERQFKNSTDELGKITNERKKLGKLKRELEKNLSDPAALAKVKKDYDIVDTKFNEATQKQKAIKDALGESKVASIRAGEEIAQKNPNLVFGKTETGIAVRDASVILNEKKTLLDIAEKSNAPAKTINELKLAVKSAEDAEKTARGKYVEDLFKKQGIGKKIESREIEGIWSAHNTGTPKFNADGTVEYSKADLASKIDALKKAGFNSAEREIIIKNFAAGSVSFQNDVTQRFRNFNPRTDIPLDGGTMVAGEETIRSIRGPATRPINPDDIASITMKSEPVSRKLGSFDAQKLLDKERAALAKSKAIPLSIEKSDATKAAERLKYLRGEITDESTYGGFPKIFREEAEKSYKVVDDGADLRVLVNNKSFLEDPINHPAVFADHGVVHSRDIRISTRETMNVALDSGLIEPQLLSREAMLELAELQAIVHDMGMQNVNKAGRTVHPELAAQMLMSPDKQHMIDALWNSKGRGSKLVEELKTLKNELSSVGIEDPKILLKELLATANAHSKSKVPIDVLNDAKAFRETMQNAVGKDLRQQLVDAAEGKAKKISNEIKKINEAAELRGVPSDMDLKKLSQLQSDLAKAKKDALEYAKPKSTKLNSLGEEVDTELLGKVDPKLIHSQYGGFDSFKQKSFAWMSDDIKANPKLRALFEDVRNTNRTLRVGDARRQRALALRTSGGHQIIPDVQTGDAFIAIFDRKNSKEIWIRSNNPLTIGEANIKSSTLTPDRKLLFEFQQTQFRANADKVADHVAHVIEDIKRDAVDSFIPPPKKVLVDGKEKLIQQASPVKIQLKRSEYEIQELAEIINGKRVTKKPYQFTDKVREKLKAQGIEVEIIEPWGATNDLAAKTKFIEERKVSKEVKEGLATLRAEGERLKNAKPLTEAREAQSLNSPPGERSADGDLFSESNNGIPSNTKIIQQLQNSGIRVDHLLENPQKAEALFENARLVELQPGETLVKAGSKPGYVYITLDPLLGVPCCGYSEFVKRSFSLVGESSAISNGPRNALVMVPASSTKPVRVIAIPADDYLRHGFNVYSPSEVKTAAKNLYQAGQVRASEASRIYRKISPQINTVFKDDVLKLSDEDFLKSVLSKRRAPTGGAPQVTALNKREAVYRAIAENSKELQAGYLRKAGFSSDELSEIISIINIAKFEREVAKTERLFLEDIGATIGDVEGRFLKNELKKETLIAAQFGTSITERRASLRKAGFTSEEVEKISNRIDLMPSSRSKLKNNQKIVQVSEKSLISPDEVKNARTQVEKYKNGEINTFVKTTEAKNPEFILGASDSGREILSRNLETVRAELAVQAERSKLAPDKEVLSRLDADLLKAKAFEVQARATHAEYLFKAKLGKNVELNEKQINAIWSAHIYSTPTKGPSGEIIYSPRDLVAKRNILTAIDPATRKPHFSKEEANLLLSEWVAGDIAIAKFEAPDFTKTLDEIKSLPEATTSGSYTTPFSRKANLDDVLDPKSRLRLKTGEYVEVVRQTPSERLSQSQQDALKGELLSPLPEPIKAPTGEYYVTIIDPKNPKMPGKNIAVSPNDLVREGTDAAKTFDDYNVLRQRLTDLDQKMLKSGGELSDDLAATRKNIQEKLTQDAKSALGPVLTSRKEVIVSVRRGDNFVSQTVTVDGLDDTYAYVTLSGKKQKLRLADIELRTPSASELADFRKSTSRFSVRGTDLSAEIFKRPDTNGMVEVLVKNLKDPNDLGKKFVTHIDNLEASRLVTSAKLPDFNRNSLLSKRKNYQGQALLIAEKENKQAVQAVKKTYKEMSAIEEQIKTAKKAGNTNEIQKLSEDLDFKKKEYNFYSEQAVAITNKEIEAVISYGEKVAGRIDPTVKTPAFFTKEERDALVKAHYIPLPAKPASDVPDVIKKQIEKERKLALLKKDRALAEGFTSPETRRRLIDEWAAGTDQAVISSVDNFSDLVPFEEAKKQSISAIEAAKKNSISKFNVGRATQVTDLSDPKVKEEFLAFLQKPENAKEFKDTYVKEGGVTWYDEPVKLDSDIPASQIREIGIVRDHHGPYYKVGDNEARINTTIQTTDALESAIAKAKTEGRSAIEGAKEFKAAEGRRFSTTNAGDGPSNIAIVRNAEFFAENPKALELVRSGTKYEDFNLWGFNDLDEIAKRNPAEFEAIQFQQAVLASHEDVLKRYNLTSDRFFTLPDKAQKEIMNEMADNYMKLLKEAVSDPKSTNLISQAEKFRTIQKKSLEFAEKSNKEVIDNLENIFKEKGLTADQAKDLSSKIQKEVFVFDPSTVPGGFFTAGSGSFTKITQEQWQFKLRTFVDAKGTKRTGFVIANPHGRPLPKELTGLAKKQQVAHYIASGNFDAVRDNIKKVRQAAYDKAYTDAIQKGADVKRATELAFSASKAAARDEIGKEFGRVGARPDLAFSFAGVSTPQGDVALEFADYLGLLSKDVKDKLRASKNAQVKTGKVTALLPHEMTLDDYSRALLKDHNNRPLSRDKFERGRFISLSSNDPIDAPLVAGEIKAYQHGDILNEAKKTGEITIFRAVKDGAKFTPGDMVGLSRKEVEQYGGKVIEMKVPLSDVSYVLDQPAHELRYTPGGAKSVQDAHRIAVEQQIKKNGIESVSPRVLADYPELAQPKGVTRAPASFDQFELNKIRANIPQDAYNKALKEVQDMRIVPKSLEEKASLLKATNEDAFNKFKTTLEKSCAE